VSAICRGVSLSTISLGARLQALDENPKFLVIGPASSPAGLNNLEPLDLSTALIAVHKHCFTAINLTQKGGLRRTGTASRPNLGRDCPRSFDTDVMEN
jgi:hypothetical protein